MTTSLVKKIRAVSISLIALFVISCTKNDIQTKNVIFMLADGCSVSSLSIARWYKQSVDSIPGTLNLDPYICGLVRTSSASSPATGSSESMSAYMTGEKTAYGYVSMYPAPGKYGNMTEIDTSRIGQPLFTLLEAAKLEKGKSTGLVQTVEFWHATPAACAAHSKTRYKEKPLCRQIASQDIDVVIGGGSKYIDEDIEAILRSKGTTVIKNDINAYKSCTDRKMWATLADIEMPFEIDRDSLTPSLAEMTGKAIELLSQNKKGFFLMVEGSKIDYAAHALDPAGQINDLIAFDEAIGVALDFAKKDKNTTVIVVADHGTSGLTIGRPGLRKYSQRPLKDFFGELPNYKASAQKLSNIIAKAEPEDIRGIMKEWTGIEITDEEYNVLAATRLNKTVDYMTAAYDPTLQGNIAKIMIDRTFIGYSSSSHTGEDVFLAIYHPAGKRIEGFAENTDVNKYLCEVMGLEDELQSIGKKYFTKASEVFDGYDWTIEDDVLIVKSNSHELKIPADRSVVYLDSTEISIPSVTVYSNGEFYVNSTLLDLLR